MSLRARAATLTVALTGSHLSALASGLSCLVGLLAGCHEEPPPLAPQPLRGGDFECRDEVCTQRALALPDDGEWECLEREGVVICRGGHGPAGVIAGAPDDAYRCGAIASDDEPRRVCVDASPDRPSPEGWRCDVVREGSSELRRCERDEAPRSQSVCTDASCPEGLACVAGRCALDREAPPDCWVDADCGGGARCVLARCAG